MLHGWRSPLARGQIYDSNSLMLAAAPDDVVVDELVEVFRAIRGEDHPDWDDFRAAMVADRRLVARLRVERVYGVARPQYASAG